MGKPVQSLVDETGAYHGSEGVHWPGAGAGGRELIAPETAMKLSSDALVLMVARRMSAGGLPTVGDSGKPLRRRAFP